MSKKRKTSTKRLAVPPASAKLARGKIEIIPPGQRTPNEWADYLNEQWASITGTAVDNFFLLGDDLKLARQELDLAGYGRGFEKWGEWCDSKLTFGYKVAAILIALARWRDERQISSIARKSLPPDYTTIKAIARLPAEKFRAFLADGTINPTVARTEIARLVSKEMRTARHRRIAALAIKASSEMPENFGPFPLIYADPPWTFEAYNAETGAARTPTQHYPTLTDEEIINFKVYDKTIPEIAHKDAALLMWCTSSNEERALAVMAAWGFTYSTSAVWVKTKEDGTLWPGLGLVFRNAHEVLLYGKRGSMPGPQHQPTSVFLYPRGEHSAKPPEIRLEIEKMYPDFNVQTRIELFARETLTTWSAYGYEAFDKAAE